MMIFITAYYIIYSNHILKLWAPLFSLKGSKLSKSSKT